MPQTDRPADGAAATFREAVAALSSRLASDFGDLVPAATAERTAALAAKLERLDATPTPDAAADARVDDADVETLDAWIRLADNFVLHGDPDELRVRTEAGQRLRAIRERLAPTATLSEDSR